MNYYSATYGRDAHRAPQKIVADHIDIVKPANLQADAYTFFARIYQSLPIVDVVETVRDNKISGLTVDCKGTNSLDDLQVPIALDPSKHEQIFSVEAELVDTDKIRDVAAPVVKKIDPFGIAHFSLALKGQGRGLLLGCPTGRASLLAHVKIRSEVPVPEKVE